jgi:dihydroflavonol-4-reductase
MSDPAFPLPRLDGRRVAVTGATGHLGTNLVPLLCAAGARVRCVLHENAQVPLPEGVESTRGDVRDAESLRRAFEGAELVFHLAARISITGAQGGLVDAINVQGAQNVAEAAVAAGARRLVHVSSVHAFDHGDPAQPLTEAAPRPTARHPAYDRSKAAGEAAVRAVAARGGLEVVVANPTGIVGPGDPAPSRMGQVLLDLYHRRLPALTPGGFDWVDVRDVSGALLALSAHGRNGEGYLLGGGWTSLVDLARTAESVTGVRAPRMAVPAWLCSATAPLVATVQGWLKQEPLYTPEALHAVFKGSRNVSQAKARADFGYQPRPLADTLRDAYADFDRRGKLRGRPPKALTHG